MQATTLEAPRTSSEPHDPWEIVASPHLSEQAKRTHLEERLRDERALLVADDDGMDGGRPSRLADVVLALQAVEERIA